MSTDENAQQREAKIRGESETSSPYDPEFCDVARSIYQLGGTSADLAEALGVRTGVLIRWQAEHAEFKAACDAGRAGMQASEQFSFFRRCTGYQIEVEHVLRHGARAFVETTREHVKPDLAACRTWLINRRPEKWKPSGNGPQTIEDFTNALFQELIESQRKEAEAQKKHDEQFR